MERSTRSRAARSSSSTACREASQAQARLRASCRLRRLSRSRRAALGGLSKEAARVDLWLKDAAPSSELRRWFGHDPEQWLEFKRRCFEELKEREDAVEVLRARARSERVTFVFASREVEHNNAVALKEYLESVRRVSG